MKVAPPRQRMLLELVADGQARGSAPTMRELAAAMGIRSTNGVADHVHYLEKKGYLERAPRRARGLRVTPAGFAMLGRELAATSCCPTCGRPF